MPHPIVLLYDPPKRTRSGEASFTAFAVFVGVAKLALIPATIVALFYIF